MNWIRVSERLPDDDQSVMVALDLSMVVDWSEPVWIGYHDADGWFSADAIPIKVTHWAKIPEPPA